MDAYYTNHEPETIMQQEDDAFTIYVFAVPALVVGAAKGGEERAVQQYRRFQECYGRENVTIRRHGEFGSGLPEGMIPR